MASESKLRIRAFSRRHIRQAFAAEGAVTRQEIATAIPRRFPELAPRLPRERRPWMSEDYRMSIFDAVSFALVFYHVQKV